MTTRTSILSTEPKSKPLLLSRSPRTTPTWTPYRRPTRPYGGVHGGVGPPPTSTFARHEPGVVGTELGYAVDPYLK